MAFYKAGKELADLHLNYEQGINVQTTGHDDDYTFFAEMPMLAHRFFGVKVIGDIDIWQNGWTDDTYQHFTVEKMKFAKVRDENGKLVADKTRIIYNNHISIENIPLKAYEYIVNGKSAIDWITELHATPYRELVYAYVAHALEGHGGVAAAQVLLVYPLYRVPAYGQQHCHRLYRACLKEYCRILGKAVGVMAVACDERYALLTYVPAFGTSVAADAYT